MRANFYRIAVVVAICLYLGVVAYGQGVPFTGFVNQDFQGATYVADANGLDLLMTGPLAGTTSGWDMMGMAMHYDKDNDRLQIGIDTAGICGDADGNGNPSQTDYYLYLSGGVDQPNFAGTESMAVCFDLDDDGIGDIIAGIPMGANVNQFRVAQVLPNVPLSQSFAAFGTDLPGNNGGILGSPVATCPDMEFSLTNFCDLLNQYASAGQTHIGVHVFLGSFDDAMIGEDFISGVTEEDFRRVALADISGGVPVVNNFQLVDIVDQNGIWKYTSGYTKLGGFVGCLLFSLTDNPSGTYLPAYGINILVGNGTASSILVTEFQAPISINPCQYYEADFYGTMGLENMTFYAQAIQFRAVYDPSAAVNYLASNRIIVGPGSYPLPLD